MPSAYVAQTRDHLLMLDENGVCLHVHRRHKDGGDEATDGAIACIGAQFVASLDPREAGFLAHAPTVGVPLLFAKVGADGRISVVRTGPLERFEAHGGAAVPPPPPPPARRHRPDAYATSVPPLAPSITYVAVENEDEEPTLRMRRSSGPKVAKPARLPGSEVSSRGQRVYSS